MLEKMNSKEALRILSECANGEKKLLFSDSLDLERIIRQDLDRKEQLERENKELQQNLVKFDNDHFQHYFKCARAIKILKPYIKISMRSLRVITFPLNIGEEYELIEEVLDHVKD